MRLFPLFLKLQRRRCLVIGGGAVSEGKIAGLLSSGARVTLVAPSVTPQIATWHRTGRLRWEKRKFRNADLEKMFLVVAATSSQEVHRRIFRQARKHGILCNIVDVPDLCDFYYPAVVKRGDLQIAISTAGASPSLAKRLRQQFEKQFGPAYAGWLKSLARERKEIQKQNLNKAEELRLLEALASETSFSAFLRKSGPKKRIG